MYVITSAVGSPLGLPLHADFRSNGSYFPFYLTAITPTRSEPFLLLQKTEDPTVAPRQHLVRAPERRAQRFRAKEPVSASRLSGTGLPSFKTSPRDALLWPKKVIFTAQKGTPKLEVTLNNQKKSSITQGPMEVQLLLFAPRPMVFNLLFLFATGFF